MPEKRLMRRDPLTGKTVWYHFDPQTTGGFVEEVTPLDGLIERNKRQANEYQRGGLIGDTQRHMQKIADIPETLYHELKVKLGDPRHNAKAWKRWLNDPDNRVFRTGGGHV